MDAEEINRLDEPGLWIRLHVIIEKVRRIDEENPGEETDPRIPPLLAEGRLICDRIDPIMQERLRDDPAALAEWDEIYHSCDDLREDAPSDEDDAAPTVLT